MSRLFSVAEVVQWMTVLEAPSEPEAWNARRVYVWRAVAGDQTLYEVAQKTFATARRQGPEAKG